MSNMQRVKHAAVCRNASLSLCVHSANIYFTINQFFTVLSRKMSPMLNFTVKLQWHLNSSDAPSYTQAYIIASASSIHLLVDPLLLWLAGLVSYVLSILPTANELSELSEGAFSVPQAACAWTPDVGVQAQGIGEWAW